MNLRPPGPQPGALPDCATPRSGAEYTASLRAVTPSEFERIAVAALDELPPWARQAMANVALVIEDEDPIEPDIYGVYDGVALPDRDGGEPLEPARIVLYRVPLEADFGDDPRLLADEIRTTVLHEIGHHFGMDEDRLDELGYG